MLCRGNGSEGPDTSTLDTLRKYMNARPHEKYPDVMINYIVQKTFDEILGEDFAKERISRRKSEKIYALLTAKIRGYYGKWVNILNFKVKEHRRISFSTNFDRVYNTDRGRLFGISHYSPIWKNVLFTSHCLERFEERADFKKASPLIEVFKKNRKAEPTAADLLYSLILVNDYSYAPVGEEEYYFDVGIGCVIMINYDNVSVVKTFLKPGTIKNVTWLRPELTKDERSYPSRHFTCFREILKHNVKKIDMPAYLKGTTDGSQK
jgi:hypothetical protein